MIFSVGVNRARADTFYIAGGSGLTTVSLDKTSYSPGSNITVTGSWGAYAFTASPGSTYFLGVPVTLSVQTAYNSSQTLLYLAPWTSGVLTSLPSSPQSGSVNFSAPPSSGSYSMIFTGCLGTYSCTTYNYPYSVSAPPTVQLYFSTLINKRFIY